MTVIWLIVWLIVQTPDVAVFGPWNSWGIALAVCFAIDLLGVLRANANANANPSARNVSVRGADNHDRARREPGADGDYERPPEHVRG